MCQSEEVSPNWIECMPSLAQHRSNVAGPSVNNN